MGDAADTAARMQDAQAALAAGRWRDAREGFRSVVADTPGAAAHEGLSWASWWLDDAKSVFAERRRAYTRYRADGNRQGAARMAIWLACDHLDFRGAASVAGGWLARAANLLGEGATPEHAWLAFFEGYLARLAGEASRAIERATLAVELGRGLGMLDTEMLGLALRGATRVSLADVGAGMRELDEATAAAVGGEVEVPIAGAWACCFLVSSCLTVRDFTRAAEWCDRIAEFAERYGSRYMLAFCRAEYGTVHMWRGRWDLAEAMLGDAVTDFSVSRPAFVGGPLAALAELRRRQGRAAEARELAVRAGPSGAAALCHARIRLDEGDVRAAADLVERVLRRIPTGARFARIPVLEVMTEVSLRRDDVDRADAAARELAEIGELVGTRPVRATAYRSGGRVAAARSQHERARVLLEDAIDGFDAAGCGFEAERTRLELADTLEMLGRVQEAGREASLARTRLEALGAVTNRSGEMASVRAVTPREREVLALLAAGLTNPEIARRLVISEHTVHRHVANLLRKLGVPTRAAAASVATRAGLVEPGR